MEFLTQYGLFLLETITLVIAILAVFAGIFAIAAKNKEKDKISVKKLNEHFHQLENKFKQAILPKASYKKWLKSQKKTEKETKQKEKSRPRLFVIDFKGDIKAHQVTGLRKQVDAILTTATPSDEVLVIIESGGGVVHGYGLAASQLERIKQRKIPLTAAVDKVAASGGYLMAAVCDKILAAPFAIIGSVGVVAQLPNFNRLLKKNHIDFEQITAGEFKRTLTLFGENTEKARQKMYQDVEDIHHLFKEFVARNRPQLDIDKVATGEHWLALRAFDLQLVDTLQTSDDYLLTAVKNKDLYEIIYHHKKGLAERFSQAAKLLLEKLGLIESVKADHFYF